MSQWIDAVRNHGVWSKLEALGPLLDEALAMRPVPGKPDCFEYGVLPLRMVNQLRDVIVSLLTAKRLALVDREKEVLDPKP